MKVVFFGTPQFAVPSLEALIAHPDFEVLAVVTQPDKRRGRGNDLSPSPVKSIALTHNLTVWQPKSIKKDQETLASLRALEADIFVVVAYGQILSQEILDMPKYGCVNGHGSLLPKYRGAAPIQWCLYHGEPETGMTTMLMDIGMDTGAMLLKSKLPIDLLQNAQALAIALSQQSAALLLETLPPLVAGTLQPEPQDPDQATYAPLINKEDYGLDWARSAIALHNQVRGLYPNCATTFREGALKVMATVPYTAETLAQLPEDWAAIGEQVLAFQNPEATPGTIVGVVKNYGAVIQTGAGLLLLREVQLAGKRAQSGWDFANGLRIQIGERVG
ncbi:methionyl-tRNA formyltransferase [Alkalinema sp. FACHB-956]|uniref:methionyl-tRNA formyltransferase n=1 Tax=Alkalinema sp. FACHB-956 TaxID=2692768 RepID=UPI001686FB17|nr:methionyl-tRNA formyltransferase [Alkalinema sp. FACHB-956]